MNDRDLCLMAHDVARMCSAPVGLNLVPLKAEIARIHEQGYVAGMEMARRLLRLQLGLAVKGDSDG